MSSDNTRITHTIEKRKSREGERMEKKEVRKEGRKERTHKLEFFKVPDSESLKLGSISGFVL